MSLESVVRKSIIICLTAFMGLSIYGANQHLKVNSKKATSQNPSITSEINNQIVPGIVNITKGLDEEIEEHMKSVYYQNLKKTQQKANQQETNENTDKKENTKGDIKSDTKENTINEKINEESRLPIIYWSKKTDEKVIAITIDDCYNSTYVKEALSLGKKYDVLFTFFPIGNVAAKNPELWKQVLKEGHEIELHSQNHAWATKQTKEQLYKNYSDNIKTFHTLVDKNMVFHFLRPSGGNGIFGYTTTKEGIYLPLQNAAIKIVKDNNNVPIDIAMWTGDSMFDSEHNLTDSNYVYNYLKNTLAPGKIYLYHTRDADFDALEKIILYAQSEGYKLVTLEELLNQ